ncbi:MAG: hypothetical protein Q9190_000736 [Brigantiaea leucoxantha]
MAVQSPEFSSLANVKDLGLELGKSRSRISTKAIRSQSHTVLCAEILDDDADVESCEDDLDGDYIDESDCGSQQSETGTIAGTPLPTTTRHPPTEAKGAASDASMVEHTFDFLGLPPEIRNRIYHLLYISPKYIGTAYGNQTRQFYKDATKWRNLGLVKVCRQIYNESADIFFIKNGFEFSYVTPMYHFMRSIGIRQRRMITKIRYRHDVYRNGLPFKALRYLRSCENITELEILGTSYYSNRVALENAKAYFLTEEYDKIEWAVLSNGPHTPPIHPDLYVLELALRGVKSEQKCEKE